MLTLELLDQHISECRRKVETGKENPNTLDYFLKLRHDLEHATDEDWAAFNELTNNLPPENADPVLIILKGQLLIESLIRKFILSRLPNPAAFDKSSFSAAQCITIAESMCLQNEEPKWLWEQVKELNIIRNKLAHNLDFNVYEPRVNAFISTFANAQDLESRTLTSVISKLYGMVKGLCDLSSSEEFKAFKI